MKSTLAFIATALLLAASLAPAQAAKTAKTTDLGRAIPNDVHLALHVWHNPERDYQREYFQSAWDTFKDEKICERAFKLITSRAPKEKLEKVQNAWNEVKEALEPINGQALMEAEECVIGQKLEGPVNQALVAVRLSEEDAANYQKGVGQLFELVQKWSKDKVTADTGDADGVEITRLKLPKESPFQPAVAHVGDVFIMSTSVELAKQSVAQLQDDSAKSKFDDPRLKKALEHLPKPEDALAFLDGEQLYKGIAGIPDFIREHAKDKDDEKSKEKIDRVAEVITDVVDASSILDYVVTVEYTDKGQNRRAELGKLAEGYDEKLLGKALTQGKPFDEWQKWVPADATAYSLSTGVNLHVLYEGIIGYVRDKFPESHEGLDKFAEMQKKVDVDLDKDILQSFSGESVSVTFPAEGSGDKPKVENVSAMKCTNPDKIRELLTRAVDGLKKLPAIEAQNLSLEDCDDLDDFQEVKANFLQMSGARPVIGFHDGWMVIASSPAAAQKFIDVRSGDAKSIDQAESFEKFNLKTDGEVYAASYCDVGAGVRQAADAIDQVSGLAPMFLMMAASEAKPEDMNTMKEAIGLLPSFAKVVRKFDFLEDRLSIMREGPVPDSYIRETVTLVRQPGEEAKEKSDVDSAKKSSAEETTVKKSKAKKVKAKKAEDDESDEDE